jgi:hypothetical protein
MFTKTKTRAATPVHDLERELSAHAADLTALRDTETRLVASLDERQIALRECDQTDKDACTQRALDIKRHASPARFVARGDSAAELGNRSC